MNNILEQIKLEIAGLEAILASGHTCAKCEVFDCGQRCKCERCCTKDQEIRKHLGRLSEIVQAAEAGEVLPNETGQDGPAGVDESNPA